MPDAPAASPAEASFGHLESGRELGQPQLAALYGYPPERTWVRANFITSLDGAATIGGRSGALGSLGDRAVFNTLRELADVIVVGAGTVRAEGYSGAHISVPARRQRQDRGQGEIPPIAIVSRSGRLNRDLAVFTRTEVAPLVFTCHAAADDTRHRLAGLDGPAAEIIDASGDDPAQVDMARVLAGLASRGLRRVLTEGGPTLLGTFIEADLLDELCLTIAPFVAGGAAPRIASGPSELPTRMLRDLTLTDDAGYLYTRYVKSAPA
ncbi:pyrimidine reductase family protein [Mycobacterium sp.]|uniref:pyrimidine reductase family protein n=1 Tax=Mycobacterium sp. TaxID=1785 RepID=UPI003A863766